MISKRTKYNTMDPKRISNYNKFLCTLDQTILNNTSEKLEKDEKSEKDEKLEKEEKDEKDEKSEKDEKYEVDKFIDIINNNFNISNYSSPNFTGQTLNDICCINNTDPNYYRDVNHSDKLFYIIPTKQNKPTIPTKEKQSIKIEAEINNISDILNLVETYKLDTEIKYNINMKALHDIKEPLQTLNNMIGMMDFKNNIVDQILYFVQELHKNNKTNGDFMHTVIYGPPGTGKTEIAKIMGKIYSKLGILSKGTFKKVTRSDLIAGYLGQTALKTRDVIKESLGGVLFIDEAYSLGNSEKKDSFAKECIDILCEALSDNKNDLMVIIAGYEKELKDCFFNYNQGLDSRFTWRFKTDEYTAENLYHIFIKMVNDIGWSLEDDSKITVEWFKKNYDYFKFYGRDIETILAKTKIAHSKRVFCKLENEKRKINLKDLDKGFEMYLKNEDVKNRKDSVEMKKYMYNTLYS